MTNENHGLALQRKDLLFDVYVCSENLFKFATPENPPNIDPISRQLSIRDAKELMKSYGVKRKNMHVRYASNSFLHKENYTAFEKRHGFSRQNFHHMKMVRDGFRKTKEAIAELPELANFLVKGDDNLLDDFFFSKLRGNAIILKEQLETVIGLLDERIEKVNKEESRKNTK